MGQSHPFFSVIVPTCERIRQLTVCLRALACQNYPRDRFEVLVVDDGSTTSPKASVDAFLNLNVRLLTQLHSGLAAARNYGATHAKGTFLAFTDDDCAPSPSWLQKLATGFLQTPDSALGGRTLNALPDNAFATATQLMIDYLYAYYNADPDQAYFLTSNNLALKAEHFRAIGGFDTLFRGAAAEDREFCDRWLSHGYRMRYAPEAIVHHAHALTFRTFWRQHFWYGRGAFCFHRIRATREAGRVTKEPLAFYWNLFRYSISRSRGVQALALAVLLMETQVANMAGFFWESTKGKKA